MTYQQKCKASSMSNNLTTRRGTGLLSFVTFRIARVQNRLNAQAAAILRKHTDLSLTEWRIVSVVNLLGHATASAISRDVGMDKGQISRAVKRLIDKKILETGDHAKDNRQTILRLSEPGKKIVTDNFEVMRDRQQRLTQNISDQELDVFYGVLERLYENAEMPDQ